MPRFLPTLCSGDGFISAGSEDNNAQLTWPGPSDEKTGNSTQAARQDSPARGKKGGNRYWPDPLRGIQDGVQVLYGELRSRHKACRLNFQPGCRILYSLSVETRTCSSAVGKPPASIRARCGEMCTVYRYGWLWYFGRFVEAECYLLPRPEESGLSRVHSTRRKRR